MAHFNDYERPTIQENLLPIATDASVTHLRVVSDTASDRIPKDDITFDAEQINVDVAGITATDAEAALLELETEKADITYVDQQDALKADKTITITAGGGLTGGGDLSTSKTIDVVSSTDGIQVNTDNIALQTIDALNSTSTTKPLSANQGKQLNDTKQSISEKGQANGYASLGADGKVPALQLPSYVDDLIEGYYRVSNGLFYQEITYINLIAGETGKIYVSLDTNKTYRWGGSSFVYITSGAVDSVAGKTGVVTLVKGDVGLGSVDNTSDANKPVSTATTTELNKKVNNTGNETISGVKTFASSPIVPNPTTPTQAANKDYIDTINTSLYVENIDGGVSQTIYGGITGIDGGTAATTF